MRTHAYAHVRIIVWLYITCKFTSNLTTNKKMTKKMPVFQQIGANED